jgi:cysteine-S-conjugate beta-lyase
MKEKKKDSTTAIHGKKNFKAQYGSITTPIFQSSAYLFPFKGESLKYPRYSNLPNQEEVVDRMVELEEGEGGVLFTSGMAAISTTFLTALKSGDHIIVQDQIYGGTFSFVEDNFTNLGISWTYFDFRKSSDFSEILKPNTKAVYIESPSNPLLQIVNIPEIGKLAKQKKIISIIDNTFATPINQKPLTLGIDVVVHSATKYLNGHSDLIAGIVIGKNDFIKRLRKNARNLGCTTNEMTAFLLSRGLKTLAIRVEKQNHNAQKLAEYLKSHKKIIKVNYPGLDTNPQYHLANSFMKGFGGMLSFEIDLEPEEMNNCLSRLKYFPRAVSLGGVESMLCLPCETSHSYLSKEDRLKLKIKDNLVRVSVGIEDIDDLIIDWKEALG